jgi:hypothetical protein
MTGALNMDGNNILGSGHITMSPQRTLTFGSVDNAQEATLVGSLGGSNSGATWYNSETGQLKYWDGTEAKVLTAGGDIGDATAISKGLVQIGDGLAVAAGVVSIDTDGVTEAKIADGAVTVAKLANNAVATAKIADGAVTGIKIADESIGLTHLRSNAVTKAKLSAAGAGTAGQVLGTDGTHLVWQSPSNPVAICNYTSNTSNSMPVNATCPAGQFIVTGGCKSSSPVTMRASHPTVAGASTIPSGPATNATAWHCFFSETNANNTAVALCCGP